MSRILITGATGFIGGYLIEFFLNKDNYIVAQGSSVDSINKLKERLEKSNLNLENVEFWQQDFLEEEWNYPNLSKIEVIIHCAAKTSVRRGTFENYDEYFTVNVLATKKIIEQALKANINHFIYVSTGQIYGHPPAFPFTETTPKNPINLYGATKLMSERVTASFGLFGLNYSIVRPFSVYGRGHNNIISIITDKIKNNEELTVFGDGMQSRSFTHINDICNAFGLIINNEKCFGEEYNLSGEKEYSINQLVEFISKRLDKNPNIVYKESNVNELQRNIADTNKIRSLGFDFQYTLENFIENELI